MKAIYRSVPLRRVLRPAPVVLRVVALALLALSVALLSACDLAAAPPDAPGGDELRRTVTGVSLTGVSLPGERYGGGGPEGGDGGSTTALTFRASTAELHVAQFLDAGFYQARLVDRATGAVLDSDVIELYSFHHDWVTADFAGSPARVVDEGTALGLELWVFNGDRVWESMSAPITEADIEEGTLWFPGPPDPQSSAFLMLLPG